MVVTRRDGAEHAKVLDFGLAKLRERGADRARDQLGRAGDRDALLHGARAGARRATRRARRHLQPGRDALPRADRRAAVRRAVADERAVEAPHRRRRAAAQRAPERRCRPRPIASCCARWPSRRAIATRRPRRCSRISSARSRRRAARRRRSRPWRCGVRRRRRAPARRRRCARPRGRARRRPSRDASAAADGARPPCARSIGRRRRRDDGERLAAARTSTTTSGRCAGSGCCGGWLSRWSGWPSPARGAFVLRRGRANARRRPRARAQQHRRVREPARVGGAGARERSARR